MSLTDQFSRTGSKGYTQALAMAASSSSSMNALNEQPKTVGRVAVDTTASLTEGAFATQKSTSAFTQITGRDHTNNSALNTKVGALASGGNAAGNLQSANTTQGVQADIQEAKGNFVKDLKETQAVIQDAFDQGVQDLGLDAGAAGRSFQPAPQRSEAGAALTAAGGAVLGGVSAIYDIKRSLGDKLNPEDEARLAEQVQKLLTPVRDADGNVIEPAAIPNNFDQEAIEQMQPRELVDMLKEVMRPPEDQPDMQYFNDLEAKLDQTLAVHNENNDVNHVVAAADVDAADVDVRDLGGNEHDIQEQLAELEQGYEVSSFAAESNQLPPTQLIPFTGDVGGYISEIVASVQSDNDKVKDADAKFHNEPPPIRHEVGVTV